MSGTAAAEEVEVNGLKHVPDDDKVADVIRDGRLMYCHHESLEYKDFHLEVRGLQDISSLLDKCTILLDVHVSRLK